MDTVAMEWPNAIFCWLINVIITKPRAVTATTLMETVWKVVAPAKVMGSIL